MTWSSGSWKTVYLNLVVLQNSRWIYFDNCTIEAAVRLVTFFPNLIMLLKFSLGWWLIIDDSNVERTVLCADGDGPDRYLHAGSVIIDSMSSLLCHLLCHQYHHHHHEHSNTKEDAPEIFGSGCIGRYQKCLWDLIEHGESSPVFLFVFYKSICIDLNIYLYLCIQAANVVSWISMMFVVVSTIGMCVNTITALKVMDDNGNLKVLAMLP